MAKDSGFSPIEWYNARLAEHRQLREDQFGYAGLAQEFASISRKLAEDFSRTNKIAHPGDKGNVREDLLRAFLYDSGYFPAKYSVTKQSARVISPTGHQSKQVDIAIYDRYNCPILLSESSLQYLPKESLYAVIETKSVLTKSGLHAALENIASCKRLQPSTICTKKYGPFTSEEPSPRMAGVIFAYTCKGLGLLDVRTLVQNFVETHGTLVSPNLICILDQGIIVPLPLKGGRYCTDSRRLDSTTDVNFYPDAAGQETFLRFYLHLLDAINEMELSPPHMGSYVDIRMTIGDHWWDFDTPHFGYTNDCPKHGLYVPELTEEGLSKLLAWTEDNKPDNWIRLTDLADGRPGTNTEAYERQPGDVYLYDPNEYGPEKAIYANGASAGITFICIIIDGIRFWIPQQYIEMMFKGCPKCKSPTRRKRR